MNDEHALLAAIAANPDDDTVRLAYADFLDETGDEVKQARAEYIRIQIHRHQWPSEPTDSARESWLYRTYWSRWRHPIPGFEIAADQRRGFPCRARASASAVLAAAVDPLACFFDELTVEFDIEAIRFREVICGPVLRGVRELSLWGDQTICSTLALIPAVGEFPRLQRLWLPTAHISDAVIGRLQQRFGAVLISPQPA